MIVYLLSNLTPVQNISAYLDPGSGSFLIQLLIGGIVGLLLVIKTFWGRIKLFLNKMMGKTPPPVVEEEQDTP
jgi:hypothetical protein